MLSTLLFEIIYFVVVLGYPIKLALSDRSSPNSLVIMYFLVI